MFNPNFVKMNSCVSTEGVYVHFFFLHNMHTCIRERGLYTSEKTRLSQ